MFVRVLISDSSDLNVKILVTILLTWWPGLSQFLICLWFSSLAGDQIHSPTTPNPQSDFRQHLIFDVKRALNIHVAKHELISACRVYK